MLGIFIGLFLMKNLVFITDFMSKFSTVIGHNQVIDVNSEVDYLKQNSLYKDFKSTDDGRVVYFSSHNNGLCTFKDLKDSLVLNGWSSLEDGNDLNGTFIRENHNFTWVFVNCTEFESTTSVVMTFD